jgi:hypothetical protein
VAGVGLHCGRRRLPALAALLFGVLLLLPLPLLGQEWGSRAYEQENPEYFALLMQLEREANGLLSRIGQVRNDTDAWLGRFPEAERVRLVQEYERSDDHRNRSRRFEQEYEKERAAKALYDDARSAFTVAQESRPEVRANLWTKHVAWRRQVVAARAAQLALLESRHVVIQGLFGLDWDEFWEDTAEDVLHVYKKFLGQYVLDVFQCLRDTGANQVGALLGKRVGPQPLVAPAPVPLVPDLVLDVGKNCLVGSGFKALVNAFEAAWNKQFLDRMKAKGVLEEVAQYWWDEIVAARLADDETLAGQLGRFFADQALSAGTQAVETVAETVTTKTLATRELPQLRQHYDALVSAANPPATADLRGQMLRTAQEGGAKRAGELLKVARLVVDYGQKAAELYANSETFAAIEANEVDRYRRVVDCLTSRGEPVEAQAVIAVLKRDAGGFATFLRECAAGGDGARVAELLDRLRGLAATARDRATQAESGCASARADLEAAQARVGKVQAELDRLAAGLAARSRAAASTAQVPDRAQELAAAAYAAAGQVVEAKQKTEASERQACTAAAQATAATTDAARAQALVAAGAAAGQADVFHQLAVEAARRAEAAAQQAAALLGDAREGGGPTPDFAARLAALAADLAAAEETGAAAANAAEAAIAAQGELARARSQSAALREELGRLLPPASRERAESDGLVGQIQRLGGGLAGCTGELPRQASSLRAAVAAVAPRLEALKPLAEPSGDEGAAAGLAESVANARASADTAEVFVAGVAELAARARACREQAEAAARTPLTPAAPAASGWTTGEVRTVSPAADPTRPTVAQPDIASLVAAATAAAEACRYPEASAHADRAATVAPADPWVMANHAKLRELAERQRAAVEAMSAGTQAVTARDFSAAGRHAETVQRLAPRCMDGLVAGWMDALNRDARAVQFAPRERQDAGRQRAGELLPGLIDIMNRAIEAGNPRPPARTDGGSTDPSAHTAQPADPCATRATYVNKWNPTPRCDCSGYTWDGLKCVPGRGSGGGTGSGSAPSSSTSPPAPAAAPAAGGVPGCVKMQYWFIDAQSVRSPVCMDDKGQTWLHVGGQKHKVLSVSNWGLNFKTGCHDQGGIVTPGRTFTGRLCPPK